MNFKRILRSVKRKLKKKKVEKGPIRDSYEKRLIEEFIKKRMDAAANKGFEYSVFPCTINGGEKIHNKVDDKEIELQLYDYESYVEKHHLRIRYVDKEFYRVKREHVKYVEIFF